jgi:hypothetical protein
MLIEARVVVNGVHVVASETYPYELAGSGRMQLILPTGIWQSLATHDHSAQRVAVEVTIRDYPSVVEIEKRLRWLEEHAGLVL